MNDRPCFPVAYALCAALGWTVFHISMTGPPSVRLGVLGGVALLFALLGTMALLAWFADYGVGRRWWR